MSVDLAGLRGSKVYLDANILIYAIEAHPVHLAACSAILSGIETGQFEAVTSELTLAEVLVGPVRDGRDDIVDVYERMLRSSIFFAVLPVSRRILRRAVDIRIRHGNRLPDAIHIATAVEAGCIWFVSADRQLKLPDGLVQIAVTAMQQSPTDPPC